MPHTDWDEIRSLIVNEEIELGPYFGHQIRNSPRHLLFTLSRYKFAAKMLPRTRTLALLEIGCSEGIGTLMLAERGHEITAIDADATAIEHARKSIEKPNIHFIEGDFIGRKLGTFDACVSLDVIEHIDPGAEGAFFDTVRQNLQPDGLCILGTPNLTASAYASKASEIGHINLFDAERFAAVLEKNFRHVFLFGMNDEVLHTGFEPMCHYLLALACTPRCP